MRRAWEQEGIDQLTPGSRIRLIRTLSGESQTQLAAQVGLTQASVTKLELGAFSPSAQSSARLCRYFSITPRWLEHGTPPVFALSAVFFSVPSAIASSRRSLRTTVETLDSLMKPFFRESEVKKGWFLPDVHLYIFRTHSTWLFLNASAFDPWLEHIVREMFISPTPISVPCTDPITSWRDLAKLLPDLLPHLEVDSAQLEDLAKSLQVHALHRFATSEESPMERVLRQIREIVARSGVDTTLLMRHLIEEYRPAPASHPEDATAKPPGRRAYDFDDP